MPSFSCSSTIRVVSGNHALTLKIKHNYFYREQSQTITKIKGRLPKDLDILLSSDLVLTLSGSLDGTDVANDVIVHSAISEHLRRCIRTNIKELGVNNISDLFIDEADGVTKMTLTSSRSPPRISRPHANLVSIDLAYIWKNTRRNTDQGPERNVNLLSNDDNPFSTQLFLPFESVLNRVTDQFMTYHLVGRHPLIFGRWYKKLDEEGKFFPSIARSIRDIINRSSNSIFLSKCRRHIKASEVRYNAILRDSLNSLSTYTGNLIFTDSDDEESEAFASTLTDEEVICMSMEQLFRAGVPQTRFQTASCSDASPHTQNDSDDFVDFAPDDVIVDPTDTHLLLWSEPSDDDTDFPLFSDSEQYISESQDVLEENRSMYSLKNEFSKEQYFIHSGSSLMGSPDSSSINTPPPEISFPIRYPTNQEFLLDFALDLGPGQLRSQDCGYEEFPESSPFYASLSPFMPNDTPHDPEITSDPVHLTLDQNAIHVCSIPQDTFQPLDSPDQVSFLDAESEDSGPMLFDLDDMLCITEDSSSYLGLLQEQAEDIAYDLNTTATILATSCHTIDTFMHQVDENETGDLFFSEVLDFDD